MIGYNVGDVVGVWDGLFALKGSGLEVSQNCILAMGHTSTARTDSSRLRVGLLLGTGDTGLSMVVGAKLGLHCKMGIIGCAQAQCIQCTLHVAFSLYCELTQGLERRGEEEEEDERARLGIFTNAVVQK
ncbi:hypothetical protein EYC80_005000 [Monilinia laxa]|uniref:Uncharacterized protein n=1 Tax=Monilinia laxa TaxID=61186 RepID=A0A5N6KIK3_MONLA|nr:hypothetical protein EYC80_005000 [Monilinia laxa]